MWGGRVARQDFLIQSLLNASVLAEKVNLGLPFYGYCLEVSDANHTAIGDPARGPCAGADVVGQRGIRVYLEVGYSVTARLHAHI